MGWETTKTHKMRGGHSDKKQWQTSCVRECVRENIFKKTLTLSFLLGGNKQVLPSFAGRTSTFTLLAYCYHILERYSSLASSQRSVSAPDNKPTSRRRKQKHKVLLSLCAGRDLSWCVLIWCFAFLLLCICNELSLQIYSMITKAISKQHPQIPETNE